MNSSIAGTDAALLAQPPVMRLDGKVAWVTGASRGLGRSLAYALAGAGAEVLLSARSQEPLEQTAAAIRAHGGVAHALGGSVADAADVERAAALVRETWGRLDVLINNAAISPTFKRSEEVGEREWRDVLETNLSGAFHCCQAAAPLMDAAGGGSIVNVSSVHGRVAHERLIAYAASKGGLEMVTRTLAIEWARRGIRVNSVAPGYLETEMTAALRNHERWSEKLLARVPLGRFGTTSEVAAAALFLASEAASYVTGTTLFIDGGWTAQ
ncbi:SDR family NAD(P)-dependent oxidoreductase [Conexibacter sp. CPCC 206217]|uniref:SDR family NAD(P)-dependent oxidoreductase n=1 Tax=Conexibacter sp. CPCC 206217 TaxID=3064574 RepID=UPI0027173524|nr:glucose 1-dehydrogenase [Conexibacter sp. CPCC 206217]MDO8212605.1 glucose 1-dehydrogenase [Conexibacter sp. CPCC 206217]